ncbi:hypothetical protein MTO96_015854 [Rhipicephalus appendiculatus]|uniref:Pancreatic trypsin inhibitor n=1 Tax=Rhipicephalus appendiculatus TaxID=34631 RepID=A0A131YJI4_RHIAP
MSLLCHVFLASFLVCITFVEGRGKGGCTLKPKNGNCTHRPWWNYNSQSHKCELIAKRCPGNMNNYKSCRECVKWCIKQKLKMVLERLRRMPTL